MPSIFRSEDVHFCNLILPTEYAYNIIRNIGELGHVQFLDKNVELPVFNKRFTQNIMWCDEMERKLKFFEEELKKEDLTPIENEDEEINAPDLNQFIELENEIDTTTTQLEENNGHIADLKKGLNELIEYRHVLRHAKKVFDEESPDVSVEGDSSTPVDRSISVVTGVIQRTRIFQLEQLLWRTCRGNLFMRHVPINESIEDIKTDDSNMKCVFVIYLQGDKLLSKVHRICEAFQASVYPYPSVEEEQREIGIGLMARIRDVEVILNQTNDQRRLYFSNICKNFLTWKEKILKIKAIYVVLNMFLYDTGSKSLKVECWCPSVHYEQVKASIKRAQENDPGPPAIFNVIITDAIPPTYYQLNKVTESYQNVVDAYGVGTYKEVNPALYTIVTFPFLFAVMFGDYGHGMILAVVGLFFVIRENALVKLKNQEMLNIIYAGRYIILFMGLFSIYTGIIYNDIFSKAVALYDTGWHLPSNDTSSPSLSDLKTIAMNNPSSIINLNPKTFARPAPYPLGIDPLWSFATNKITVSNSFKMKTSIILGVVQMTFGIFLSLVNHIYFKHYSYIFYLFIPQILFFLCFFGYLAIMIFYKWIYFSASSPHQPSLLLMLLGMVLNFNKPIPDAALLYHGQAIVEPVLVVVAFVSIPWMLLLKPLHEFILRCTKKHLLPYHYTHVISPAVSAIGHTDAAIPMPVDNYQEQHTKLEFPPSESPKVVTTESPLGEVFILQVIHTIEFVLGCISNTASYLRLWALSLAHSQLSEVLWNMLLRLGLSNATYGGSIMVFALSLAFSGLTIAILVVMEGLSAFLHALRLHWVEFQNKFYEGSGTAFQPFTLKEILIIKTQ